ncbi:LAMI_0G09274g1_1 [Lachancea mirantina]|uniref:LAMI_0G09274g1_1 n=1 Tax=Lachancea mirantina TaxID=1230905 RepID=A0A1G4KAA5_9SACH|nr:LAMI_0G09274g1_1 [Lachancea mirantina]
MERSMDPSLTSHDEVQPLLAPNSRRRGDSVASFISRGRANTVNSLKSGYETVKRHKVQFLTCLFGAIFLYLGFTLAFLPRTSLSRDLRRLHFSSYTKAEAYRVYLEALTEKNELKKHLRNYTAHRHLSGDERVFQYTFDTLKSYGFSPSVEKYYPWLNEPIDTEISLWENGQLKLSASKMEDPLDEDPSSQAGDSVPAFHGYSANGDVTARFVFCNYGRLDDYKFMENQGIELEGKVHIIRYGSMFRGLKVKNAEAHGAAAVILYTDPFDDGEMTVKNGHKAYPEGPARNPSGIQRGSVEFFTESPGDPTTPGYASKSRSMRRDSPAGRVPGIPSVPMSARDASKILVYLNEQGVRIGKGGDIQNFDYFTGPSQENVKIRVYNEQKYEIKETKDIIVEIPGILRGSSVIIGNHRDSWTVGGAGDPNSGSSILLEIARGLDELRSKGWKPLRTIKLISWDAEEPAMIGSTEYGEDHADKLKKEVLAYFNLDTAVSGWKFTCEANPLLANLLRKAAHLTPFSHQPEHTLYDYWLDQSSAEVGILGSGTDFAVFQNHLGIPSVNIKFEDNKVSDAVYQYHTNYDSYTWMEKFVDPEYDLHNTLAMFVGLSALMLTENELVSFQSTPYVQLIKNYFDRWHTLLLETFKSQSNVIKKASNVSELLSYLAFNITGPFDDHLAHLRQQTTTDYPFWSFYKKIGIYLRLSGINKRLKTLDRLFLTEMGLKDREWMKHAIFGPDKFEGYIGDVLPGLHEAILSRDEAEAEKWLEILEYQISKMIKLLTLD